MQLHVKGVNNASSGQVVMCSLLQTVIRADELMETADVSLVVSLF